MSVGGTDGQVLTQHADRPPTWEDLPDAGASALGDLADVDPDGAHDGDVLTYQAGAEAWTAQAPGAGSYPAALRVFMYDTFT